MDTRSERVLLAHAVGLLVVSNALTQFQAISEDEWIAIEVARVCRSGSSRDDLEGSTRGKKTLFSHSYGSESLIRARGIERAQNEEKHLAILHLEGKIDTYLRSAAARIDTSAAGLRTQGRLHTGRSNLRNTKVRGLAASSVIG
ncbi:hypothetical protein DFH09DRAFT_1286337 [Mycena vulgaris]|nr:hypothetical protein DFH09DRAFT_1286337 [Mycena vulgaris]